MMISRIGTGCITTILVIGLGSCSWDDGYVAPYVGPERAVCRVMGMPCLSDCARFYNNGHHDAWADCMGVPYK